MTLPNNKAAEKTPQKKVVSPVHMASPAADPSVEGTSMLPQSHMQIGSIGLFAWLRVFRYANLLSKQGC